MPHIARPNQKFASNGTSGSLWPEFPQIPKASSSDCANGESCVPYSSWGKEKVGATTFARITVQESVWKTKNASTKNLPTVQKSYFTRLQTTSVVSKKLMTKLDSNPCGGLVHLAMENDREDQRATDESLLKKDRFAAHWHLKKKQQKQKRNVSQ